MFTLRTTITTIRKVEQQEEGTGQVADCTMGTLAGLVHAQEP